MIRVLLVLTLLQAPAEYRTFQLEGMSFSVPSNLVVEKIDGNRYLFTNFPTYVSGGIIPPGGFEINVSTYPITPVSQPVSPEWKQFMIGSDPAFIRIRDDKFATVVYRERVVVINHGLRAYRIDLVHHQSDPDALNYGPIFGLILTSVKFQ